jgi:hypothetical protein
MFPSMLPIVSVAPVILSLNVHHLTQFFPAVLPVGLSRACSHSQLEWLPSLCVIFNFWHYSMGYSPDATQPIVLFLIACKKGELQNATPKYFISCFSVILLPYFFLMF